MTNDEPRRLVRLGTLDDTARFAQAIAPLLREGDVVLLVGDIGAGKTTFTRSLAAALGVTDEVTSPTFTIMRHHARPGTSTPLLHLDAYRLHGPADADDLGLDELLDAGAIAIIEWGDVIADALGPDRLVLHFAIPDLTAGSTPYADGDTTHRTVAVRPEGSWRASSRATALDAACAPFRTERATC